MVPERQREIVEGFIAKGLRGGRAARRRGAPAQRPGFWIEPTVFADVTDGMAIARDEIFGPVMSVLDFDTEEEVLARANATEFGLAAGVFTRTSPAGTGWRGVRGGDLLHQRLQPHAVEAPFGGMKRSGHRARERAGRPSSIIRNSSPSMSAWAGMGALLRRAA
jgi:betaine-aldehyde dehydrogenase